MVYLDDILIFSKSIKDHTFHVRLFLEKLRKFSLQVKLSKCLFDQTEIEFLGFIVNRNGKSMDSSRVIGYETSKLITSDTDLERGNAQRERWKIATTC